MVLGDSLLLDASGNPLLSIVSQPRRYALLLYLALENPGGTVRRDTLLPLFWPESTDNAGRHALRQALFHIRRSLGSDAVTGTRQEQIGVDPTLLRCDGVEFRAAVAAGAFEEAVRLYKGDLLPGFHLDQGSPQFDQWLERERVLMRKLACDAAWRAAESAAAGGNTAAAGSFARTCATLSEWDEAILCRSLSLLTQLGDRTGAIVAYEQYAKRLWQEYETVPSDMCRELVQTLRQNGAAGRGDLVLCPEPRMECATPTPITARTAVDEQIEPTGTRTPPRGPSGQGLKNGRLLALGLIIVALVSVWGSVRGPAAAVAPRPTRVLIEPIQDYTGARDAHRLTGALTIMLAGILASHGNAETVLLDQNTADPDGAGNAFNDEGTTYILRAGLLNSSGPVRLSVVLLDRESRATIGHALITHAGVDDRVESMAEQVATFVDREIASALERERLQRGAPSQHALALVREAIRDRAAIDSLRQAGAVEAAVLRLHKADSILSTAQERAPGWPEPTVQRAENQLELMWLVLLTGAGREEAHAALRRVHAHAADLIRSDGENVAALELRAVANYWLWRTGTWQSEAPPEELSRAIEADLRLVVERKPTSGRGWNLLSAMLFSRGEFAEAYWAAERAYRADIYGEYAADIAARLFAAALESKHKEGAAYWCNEIGRRHRRDPGYAYCRMVLLASGPADEAHASVADAQSVLDERVASPWKARLEMLYAGILARAGESEQALLTIERARAAASSDPELAPLEAWARLRLNDMDKAERLLSRYVAARPHTRTGVLRSYRFADLR